MTFYHRCSSRLKTDRYRHGGTNMDIYAFYVSLHLYSIIIDRLACYVPLLFVSVVLILFSSLFWRLF
jgi:hypothetical protein